MTKVIVACALRRFFFFAFYVMYALSNLGVFFFCVLLLSNKVEYFGECLEEKIDIKEHEFSFSNKCCVVHEKKKQ